MKISSFFKDVQNSKTKPSSRWPHLNLLKIISFPTKDNTAKFASILHDSSCSQLTCFSEAPQHSGEELLEMATKALKSRRLFFQPGHTSSILEAAAEFQSEDYVALTIESEDPFLDFRNSMKEMIEAYGPKYWEHLEELLALYLRMNRKNNHGHIIGAFIDIFAGASSSSSSSKCAKLSYDSSNKASRI